MSGPTGYTWFSLNGPPRLVFDLRPAATGMASGALTVEDGLVRAVRWATHPEARVRVVLDLTRPAPHRAFWLTDPPRLVLDVDRLEVTLYDHERSVLTVLPFDEYLAGVLAAEMPASFQLEALRAQAVAARTYTLRRLRAFGGRGCPAHPGADVCSDPGHCQGYRSPERLREDWKEDFQRHFSRLTEAVGSTRRLFLAHGQGPADTVYHSTCGGHTASAAEAWGQTVPYLPGVPCEYCEISPRYRETKRFSLADLERRLGTTLVGLTRRTPSGRAESVEAGGRTFSGLETRSRLGLPSSLIQEFGGELTVTTRGWGHGVGLCQWGAEGQARLGRTFREILRYYYPGTTISGVSFSPAAAPPGLEPAPPGAPGDGPAPEPTPPGEPAPPPPGSLPVVVLDPGHGGLDPGASGPGGLAEKDVNLAVVLAAAEVLAGRAEVHLTRREDRTVSLRERTDLAEVRKAVLFLSVHNNGSVHPEAGGTETYHYPPSSLGAALAGLVHRRVLAAAGRRDRGVKQANFFVLRESKCPAALVEVLFITNPEEARLLADREFQRRVGEAVAAGVLDYLEKVR